MIPESFHGAKFMYIKLFKLMEIVMQISQFHIPLGISSYDCVWWWGDPLQSGHQDCVGGIMQR